MSNSDTDAFESADEDFEEQKAKKGFYFVYTLICMDEKSFYVFLIILGVVKSITKHEKHVKVSEHKIVKEREDEQKSEQIETPLESLKEHNHIATTAEPLWKSWGAFSLISNASKSVASITTQVSQHISTAIDNLNIPEPEQMAKVVSDEEKQSKGDLSSEYRFLDNVPDKSINDNKFNMGNLLSGVSEMSSKMVFGGLDTLEGIGRKTINILHENDPNLKNKILGMSHSEKPNLSEILKEAKERPEDTSQKSEIYTLQLSFEQLLDDYKGFVYLEAIEILSNHSKMRIESLIKLLDGKALTEMEETLEEVRELCEFPESDNFEDELTADSLETKLETAIEDLNITLNFKEIVCFTKECHQWLNDLEHGTINLIYEKSINVMANSCALSIGNLQKLAELLLSMDHRSTPDEADALTKLVTIIFSL